MPDASTSPIEYEDGTAFSCIAKEKYLYCTWQISLVMTLSYDLQIERYTFPNFKERIEMVQQTGIAALEYQDSSFNESTTNFEIMKTSHLILRTLTLEPTYNETFSNSLLQVQFVTLIFRNIDNIKSRTGRRLDFDSALYLAYRAHYGARVLHCWSHSQLL